MKKPQGWKAIKDLSSGEPFKLVELPAEKAERELLIAEWFAASLVSYHSTELQIRAIRQLPENDHDIEAQTDRGTRLLQLTEFAPLQGSYSSADDMLNVGRTADALIDAVWKKAKHYSPLGAPVILLIYTTHYAFEPFEDVFALAEFELRKKPPYFDQIYFLMPTSPAASELRLMHPTAGDNLTAPEVANMRKRWFANSDMTKE